jgi:hypothetical protein
MYRIFIVCLESPFIPHCSLPTAYPLLTHHLTLATSPSHTTAGEEHTSGITAISSSGITAISSSDSEEEENKATSNGQNHGQNVLPKVLLRAGVGGMVRVGVGGMVRVGVGGMLRARDRIYVKLLLKVSFVWY